jgi:hypothetical protein
MDLGHVFYFDDVLGLREIGRTHLTPPGGIICSNTQPTTVAVSPDGARLAVGTVDDLACVYLYRQPKLDVAAAPVS